MKEKEWIAHAHTNTEWCELGHKYDKAIKDKLKAEIKAYYKAPSGIYGLVNTKAQRHKLQIDLLKAILKEVGELDSFETQVKDEG